MLKYFNEYGNVYPNSAMDKVRRKIENIVEKFAKEMIDNGASYLELRAFGQMISPSVDFQVTMAILEKQMKQKEFGTSRKIYRKASRKTK